MSLKSLVILVVLVFLDVACTGTKKPLDLPVCQVARAKTAYTEVVKIPDQVKAHITAYKKSWTELCDRKSSASVHQTLSLAKILEEKFI